MQSPARHIHICYRFSQVKSSQLPPAPSGKVAKGQGGEIIAYVS